LLGGTRRVRRSRGRADGGDRRNGPSGNWHGRAGRAEGGEWNHTVSYPFHQRLGNTSHLGVSTAYANPGALWIPGGLKAYMLQEYERVGWYVSRGLMKTNLLECASVVGADPGFTGRTRKDQSHEFGGVLAVDSQSLF
jgi:hypothetical protein